MTTAIESSIDVYMSREMHSFCCKHALELAEAYNSALHAGLEEMAAFNPIMDNLGVPRSQQEDLLLQTMVFKDLAGLAKHRLSPMNQFLTALVPYLAWCFQNRLAANSPLCDEAARLVEDPCFPRYVGKEIGWRVSQKVGGALRMPSKVSVVSTLILVPAALLLLWPSFWHVIHQPVIQWVIWILSFIWAILCAGTFVGECLGTRTCSDGLQRFLPLNTRRLITGINAFGVAAALCVTAISGVPKFHLLWILPLLFWGPKNLRTLRSAKGDRRV
jgi:hypothetical protein